MAVGTRDTQDSQTLQLVVSNFVLLPLFLDEVGRAYSAPGNNPSLPLSQLLRPWRSHMHILQLGVVYLYMLPLRRSIVCLALSPSLQARNMACSVAGHQQVKHEATRLQRIAVLSCPVTALIVLFNPFGPSPCAKQHMAKRCVDANGSSH